jgi:uncharacterized protein (DUF697 family)
MDREQYIAGLKKAVSRLAFGVPPDVSSQMSELVKRMPTPVFWLLGKTQSGKSSVVKAITGVSQIAIGEGFKACTKTSALYSFPAPEAPLVNFLDTRGLFEAGYDATEDIAFCEEQAHLLMVVVRAGDHALGQLFTTLGQITRRHPEWPVLVVQTCLHEGYERGQQHLVPYPYSDELRSPPVPRELVDHLNYQRKLFSDFQPTFVAVDFTQPGDGYEPLDYGHEAFFAALEKVLPEVTWNILRDLDQGEMAGSYWKAAQPHIVSYSLMAGSLAAVPIPLIDLPLITGVQLKLLHSLAGVYRQPLSYKTIFEIASAVGLGYIFRLGSRELFKVLPGGSVLNSVYVAASTYALGNVFCAYFKYIADGATPDKVELRRILKEQMAVGEKLFIKWKKKSG